MLIQILAILCVIGLSVGQILFKISANYLSQTGNLFELKTILTLLAAFALYGITSIAWVWILQKTELGRVYPLMAFAFILVPLGSYFIFGERFHFQYFLGVALIVSGIVIAVR